jgi:hypothetical protein
MSSSNVPDYRFILIDGLSVLARESALRINRYLTERPRHHLGDTLRPGPQTPLWNAFVNSARPLLKKRGEKIKLARLIGVPRQRIHDYLVGRGRMPDAERMLLLLDWLAARRRGMQPG